MLARTIKINAKILMAFVLGASFLAAAAFDERARAEQHDLETGMHTQIIPLAE